MELSVVPRPDAAFWNGRRVLLTGHTGFKGSWTALWLSSMGAKVTGFALAPDAYPSLFELAAVENDVVSRIGDLRDADAVSAAVEAAEPQIVIHMGAQALVRRSIKDPGETFAINVMGTSNLLEALRERSALQAVLVITSDKVYANDGSGRAFKESDPLGGKDPYSASKAAAEMVTRTFAESCFKNLNVPVATARAGNIIGGGDFAVDRLVPDTIRAMRAKKELMLRHPDATRPWQHVLDCVNGYLLFTEALAQKRDIPRALNFGPPHGAPVTVATLAEAIMEAFDERPKWQVMPEPGSIEMTALALDSSSALNALGWRTIFTADTCVVWTAAWYRSFAAGNDLRRTTLEQISEFNAARVPT